MNNYKDYLEGTAHILKDSQSATTEYEVCVLDKMFTVLPGVFSPKYFLDTEIFAKHVPILKGQKVLEIGPGTGVFSIFCAYQGADKVVCVDINEKAVLNTEKNISRHNYSNIVNVRHGNVYSPIQDHEKFDVIFWNVPFGYVEDESLTNLEKSVFDNKYQSIKEFIHGAPAHLEAGGTLYIGFSDTLGRVDLLQKYIREAGFVCKKIYSENSTEVHPVTFDIYECRR